jgi:hypothetical protein
MTRYLSAEELDELVRSAGDLPGASDLLDVLSSWTGELIPVYKAHPVDMLSGYEIRLAWSQSGEGPQMIGMGEFVEVLREADSDMGIFAVLAPSANYVGLTNETGTVLIALVKIVRPDQWE